MYCIYNHLTGVKLTIFPRSCLELRLGVHSRVVPAFPQKKQMSVKFYDLSK